ncbi:MAG: heparinase II/III family protein [Hyphomicrobiaceae bacterium]
MTQPTLGERLRMARLRLDRTGSVLRARTRRFSSPISRTMRPIADELLFVPPDLRPGDPGILDELRSGQLGLSGHVYEIGLHSPFSVTAAAPEWMRALHSFVWLGSLRAEGSDEAQAVARRMVFDWCRRHRSRNSGHAEARELTVTARRVIAWIVNAGLLLDGAPPEFHTIFCRTLGASLRDLDRRTALASPGYDRLTCLMALTLACLSIAGHDRQLTRLQNALEAELRHQILADGGHISRNNDIVLDVLLDLLPIRQCYLARGLTVPLPFTDAIARMMLALKSASTTSRALARFNGVSLSRSDTLALVLSLDEAGEQPTTGIGPSRYARLQAGMAIVIADCGAPPPLEYATLAHAGCLAFEFASRDREIIVNRGAPAPGYATYRSDARATASHSTLVAADQSSSHLVRSRALEAQFGSPPISGPDTVTARIEQAGPDVALIASHDGYLKRLGLIHERHLTLTADGRRLTGRDLLRGPREGMRLARDIPFAIRFHIAVGVTVMGDHNGVVITTADGENWRFSAEGAHFGVETAVDYAMVLGPTPARQIVLRGTCAGESEITWRLELFSPLQ